MKFYNRQTEIGLLKDNIKGARKQSSFMFVVGRRRIGKTSLLMEAAKGEKVLYLFVSRKSEAMLCADFQRQAEDSLGVKIYGRIDRFKDLLAELLKFSESQSFTLIIDEFQDFERVNKSIFSEIQDVWDRFLGTSKINLIVSGSIYSLMVKQFEDNKEPLFGRATSKLHLKAFSVSTMKKILHDYNPNYTADDLLSLYMITGGIPKYIALLMDDGAVTKNKMFSYVFREDSMLLTDGKDVLISEFGTDYGTYFSVLQLIAQKKNSQGEIDSVIGKNTGVYLLNLESKYSIVSRMRPIFAKPGSRNARWVIDDQYMRFWFAFIYANQSLAESGRLDVLKAIALKHYADYSGAVLEDYFRKKISEESDYSRIGRSWDNKGVNEIDIVAVDDLNGKALIAEVKRDERRINMNVLRGKAASLEKELAGYEVEYAGFSLKNM